MPELEELKQKLAQLQAEEDDYQASKVSGIESLARGAGQGVTMGWSDEGLALLKSITGGTYDEELEKERKANELAKKANPITYGVGEYGAPLLIPGMGVAKAASTAGKIGIGAAGGALTGLGFTDEEKLSGEGIKNTLIGGATGGALTAAGLYGSKLLKDRAAKKAGETVIDISDNPPPGAADDMAKMAKDSMPDAKIRPDFDEVKAAWDRQNPGKPMPSYFNTLDKQKRDIADDILTSQTVAGKLERKTLQPAWDAVDNVASKIREQSQNIGKADAGGMVTEALKEELEVALKPAQEIYQKHVSKLKGIPIRGNGKVIKSSLTRMNNTIGKTSASSATDNLINDFRDRLSNINTLDKLMDFRTSLYKAFPPGSLSDEQTAVVAKLYETVTNERNRTILNHYLKGGGKKLEEMSRAEAAEILAELQKADKIWAQTMKDFSAILPVGNKRGSSSFIAINNYLNNVGQPGGPTLESVANHLWKTNNVAGLEHLQRRFPKAFEILRSRQLGQFVDNATLGRTGSAESSNIIARAGKILDPRAKKIIFGEKLGQDVSDAQKLLSAVPASGNPSQSATKAMNFERMLNPLRWPEEAARQTQYAFKRSMLNNGKLPADYGQKFLDTVKSSPKKIIIKLSGAPGGSKYSQMLSSALERGQPSYASTYFLLQQSDPEFRRLVEDNEGQ